MNKKLLSPDVQEFLEQHRAWSPSDLALKKSPFERISSSELAEQLDGWQRSRHKLPLWNSTPGIYFPSRLALEQCSSEATARYKSRLLKGFAKIFDLTGGFGVDSYYFSLQAAEVVYCEINPALAAIVDHNSLQLKAFNLGVFPGDGVEFIQQLAQKSQSASHRRALRKSAIFIDPARRIQHARTFKLEETLPNPIAVHRELLEICPILMIKAAPMLDIEAALKRLDQVSEVHVVSLDNECKEVLFVLKNAFKGEPQIHIACLKSDKNEEEYFFTFTREQERVEKPFFSVPLNYLYEPDAAVLKAGAYKTTARRFELDKLHPNTHLYTSRRLEPAFPGKTLEIQQVESYNQFKKSHPPHERAVVVSKNFPISPAELRKKHRIEEGVDDHLYFCRDHSESLIVIHCRVIHPNR